MCIIKVFDDLTNKKTTKPEEARFSSGVHISTPLNFRLSSCFIGHRLNRGTTSTNGRGQGINIKTNVCNYVLTDLSRSPENTQRPTELLKKRKIIIYSTLFLKKKKIKWARNIIAILVETHPWSYRGDNSVLVHTGYRLNYVPFCPAAFI